MTLPADTALDFSAAPGSTEWIKVHLARMDEPALPGDDLEDRQN